MVEATKERLEATKELVEAAKVMGKVKSKMKWLRLQ